MKKILTLICVMFFAVSIQAQTAQNISTNYKQTCYWSKSSAAFTDCGDNKEYSSLFKINSDATMFYHTTNDIKSTYYVSKKNYLSNCDCYSYDVISDVGNKYTFIVDLEKNQLKIMSLNHSSTDDDYMILFKVKSNWKD